MTTAEDDEAAGAWGKVSKGFAGLRTKKRAASRRNPTSQNLQHKPATHSRACANS